MSRVLVVEDEAAIAELIAINLRHAGYEITLAATAEQALAARFQIRSIPTLALFWQGREIARQPGAMGQADIVRWARAALARPR